MSIIMTDSMKIILADDHPLFRQALTITLKANFSNAEVFEAQTIPELEKYLEQVNSADLLLLDLDIPLIKNIIQCCAYIFQ